MSAHDELLALFRQMHAAGERLTYPAITARRGGGSRRDIAKALDDWKQDNPTGAAGKPGRPSKNDEHLREIIGQQEYKIRDLEDEIHILKAEIASLSRMVRKYRRYPEDFDEQTKESWA